MIGLGRKLSTTHDRQPDQLAGAWKLQSPWACRAGRDGAQQVSGGGGPWPTWPMAPCLGCGSDAAGGSTETCNPSSETMRDHGPVLAGKCLGGRGQFRRRSVG